MAAIVPTPYESKNDNAGSQSVSQSVSPTSCYRREKEKVRVRMREGKWVRGKGKVRGRERERQGGISMVREGRGGSSPARHEVIARAGAREGAPSHENPCSMPLAKIALMIDVYECMCMSERVRGCVT